MSKALKATFQTDLSAFRVKNTKAPLLRSLFCVNASFGGACLLFPEGFVFPEVLDKYRPVHTKIELFLEYDPSLRDRCDPFGKSV